MVFAMAIKLIKMKIYYVVENRYIVDDQTPFPNHNYSKRITRGDCKILGQYDWFHLLPNPSITEDSALFLV